jgi:hypothetical protein
LLDLFVNVLILADFVAVLDVNSLFNMRFKIGVKRPFRAPLELYCATIPISFAETFVFTSTNSVSPEMTVFVLSTSLGEDPPVA